MASQRLEERVRLFCAATLIAALMSSCGGSSGGPTTSSLSAGGNGSGGTVGSGGSGTTASGSCDTNRVLWGGNTGGAGAPSSISRFTNTGYMTNPRASHTATLLSDGKVLVVNGGQLDIDDLLVSIVSAEIFDPSVGKFAPARAPCVAREFHSATLLKTGEVLITGGNEFSGYPTWLRSTATAELYDPAIGKFAKTGNMAVGRTYHTATLLADGRVLVVGGSPPAATAAEIYDPATSMFSATANMPTVRAGHTATMLPSGEVLIIGGQNDEGTLATAELYDAKTNTFTATGSMAAPRTGHTATLLANGKVLVAGGAPSKALVTGGIDISASPQVTAELYDPLTGLFVATASMSTGRIGHTATLLPDGTVLIAGGFKDYSSSGRGYESYNSAEIYDPVTASFSATDPMNTARFWHAATILRDGRVLFTGGIGADLALASAEIYKSL